MITECYIKGRYDFGSGRCAVVITEDTKQEAKTVLHQVAWKVPDEWNYNGETIKADQYNCEILAAVYALNWCRQNDKEMVNIYANTNTCQKWYLRGEIPESRAMRKAYHDAVRDFNNFFNQKNGKIILERIYAEYVPKSDKNEFNQLVNSIAERLK